MFVLFDSHSKRPDVISLREKLDLLRRQLLGEVVSDILGVVESGFDNAVAYDGDGPPDDQFEGYISPFDSIRSDTVRNGLSEMIRSNENRFTLLRRVSRLPKAIHALNVAVFWLFVAVAVVAFSCVGFLLAFEFGLAMVWALLTLPVCVVIAAGIVVVIRETKIQYAEDQILNFDPQV